MTLENLFLTPFKLTVNEQVAGTLASIFMAIATERHGAKSLNGFDADLQYGYTASASEAPVGPRFVRITDIRRGRVDWVSVPYCECAEREKYLLEPGDILIARTGSVGKSFLVEDVPEDAVFASYLIRVRGGPDLDPDFVYWALQSVGFWDHVSKRRGTAQKNVNAKVLARFEVPNISLAEQSAIAGWLAAWEGRESDLLCAPTGFESVTDVAESLATVTQLHRMLERTRSEVEALTPSVLNRAFVAATTRKS